LIASIVPFGLGWWTAGGIGILAALFILYFFRDPERIPPKGEDIIVSPADGKVDTVEIVEHPAFPGGRAQKVGIFLSIFDVHINRAPMDGRVVETRHRPGRFLNAMKKESSFKNESNLIALETQAGPIYIKQIAGWIARRIVCHLKKGDEVQKGARIGLICFGSRTEAFLPLHAAIKVKPGTRVTGGESVLAILPTSHKE